MIFCLQLIHVHGGLEPFYPQAAQEIMEKIYTANTVNVKEENWQEHCCFYANKSGIVRDKIKKLQDDLEKRRKELFDNPLWSGLNGMLPYLLPLLGPLVSLLIMLSLRPCLFNKIMTFLKQQVDTIKMQPIQVHYHKLDMAEGEI